MTERIQAAIEASRERERKDYSGREMAAVLSELASTEMGGAIARTLLDEPRFREALLVALEGVQPCVTPLPCGKYPGVLARELCRRCATEARIDRILAGETEPGGGGG